MRGVKLWIAARATDRRLDPIAQEAVALKLPLLQHAALKTTGNLQGESTPDDVLDLADRHPRLTVIMDHLTLVGVRGVLAIRSCPNIWLDTSGGEPCTGITDFAIRHLGSNRILFGSDAPGRNYAVQLARVRDALPAGPDRDAVLGKTAQRLFRL